MRKILAEVKQVLLVMNMMETIGLKYLDHCMQKFGPKILKTRERNQDNLAPYQSTYS